MNATDELKIYQSVLDSKYHQLTVINELTCAINNNYSNEEILELYAQCLKSVLKIDKVYMISQSNGWEKIFHKNIDGEIDISLLVQRFLQVITPQKIEIRNSFLQQFEIVVPVLKSGAPTAYALLGPMHQNNFESYSEILEFLHTLTNVVNIVVENNRLHSAQLESDFLIRDLGFAAEVQNMLVAKDLPHNDVVEMSAYYQPQKIIGGDYYDYLQLNKDEFVFCIADISGKGISAALLMANFQSTLRILVRQDISEEKFIAVLNKNIYNNTEGDKYLTLFIAKYNKATRQLTYINAGHTPPLLATDTATVPLLFGTTMLGAFPTLPHFQLGTITVPQNALLFAYTDGLFEIESEGECLFDKNKILTFLELYKNNSTRMIVARIVAQMKSMKNNRQVGDDICILATRFK